MKLPVWLILIIQFCLILSFELIVTPDLKFASSYLGPPSEYFHFVAILPAVIFLGLLIPVKWRPLFYGLLPAIFIRDLQILTLLYGGTMTFYVLTNQNKKSAILTMILLGTIITLLTWSVTYSPNWLLTLIHLSWGLKAIAWIVTVRVYEQQLSSDEFIEYFYHPAFFFFTCDLNVLTPGRFRSSYKEIKLSDSTDLHALGLTVAGLVLLMIYGLLQVHFFRNSVFISSVPMLILGGLVSVGTAILFHTANVSMQVSLLRSSGYTLPVDMNKPWLATSTLDYWRRMHYYVRDYVFEIIMKPVLTQVLRKDIHLRYFRLIAVIFLYLLFTLTQIGYHPYRTDRNLAVNAIINLIFIVMVLLPEMLKALNIRIPTTWSRTITFLILITGYTFIFALRKGF